MARGSRIPIDEKIAKAQEKADRAKRPMIRLFAT